MCFIKNSFSSRIKVDLKGHDITSDAQTPSGLSAAKFFSLLVSIGLVLYGFAAMAGWGMSAVNSDEPIPLVITLRFYLPIAFGLLGFLVIFIYSPKRAVWIGLVLFWLLQLGYLVFDHFNIWLHFCDTWESVTLGNLFFPMLLIIPLVQTVACLLYFQTRKVKQYYGISRLDNGHS
jgi:hypothetical protein